MVASPHKPHNKQSHNPSRQISEAEKRVRVELRRNFEFYARKNLKIRTKDGNVEPFILNQAQQFLHQQIEDQLHATGKVRVILLKGRQQGASTYIGGRYYWKVTHQRGRRVFILTHLADATANLFAMVKRYHDYCHPQLRPSTSNSNRKELDFDLLDSSYRVGTAGSSGVGRSDTIQYFHGSEVAFWPEAAEHMKGVGQAVPNSPGTEIILESTSNGPEGWFYDTYQTAEAGESQYRAVFIPWFWQQEYSDPVPAGFAASDDERDLQETYGLTDSQLVWRRNKISEIRLGGFMREYPNTAREAFEVEVRGALWLRATLDKCRARADDLPDFVRIVIAVDPAVSAEEDSDETGIMIGAKGSDGRGYLLKDLSCVMSPEGWGRRVVTGYHKFHADMIVCEVNNGGDLVASNIKTIDPKIKIKKVHASRGKAIRAEPVSALYEQGRINHVGRFERLENQLCMMCPDGYVGEGSPDRVDAVVWLWTELFLEGHDFRRESFSIM